MNKKILLIDADSTIINIALAKISTYHKKRGDDVTLMQGMNSESKIDNWLDRNWDEVYISCIFTKNKEVVIELSKQFPNSVVHLGGTGIDLVTELPTEIDNSKIDNSIYYDIYPETKDTCYGFFTRGCIRKCEFCFVPKKEGKVRPVADLYDIWDGKAKRIIALDNNILALPKHFEKIANQIIDEKLSIEFNQGLDIRLITDENAILLKKLKVSDPKFAWDDVRTESAVIKGIDTLKRHGINRSVFYVLIGFNSTFEEDLYRLNKLREMGQRAYVMPFDKENLFKKDERYQKLSNWANARMVFASATFEEYINGNCKSYYSMENKKKNALKETIGKDILEF
jgi:hypothetical protein